ncbi:MAG: cation transporting ATPase C-terminal domain-containing protein, partial [Burkholderiaceae bacterium]
RYVLYAIAACAAFQLAYVYSVPLQNIFGSTPLSANEWLRVLLAGALLFLCSEIEKKIIAVLGIGGRRIRTGSVPA